jgi:hypothetical protein
MDANVAHTWDLIGSVLFFALAILVILVVVFGWL